MKANKDHISLETAKLLKDCGVKSEYIFGYSMKGTENDGYYLKKRTEKYLFTFYYPAFTWQEIEDEAEEFLGVQEWTTKYDTPSYFEKVKDLLYLRLEKKYDEADEYFREHCILIKKND